MKAGSNIRELRFTPANKVPYGTVWEQLGALKNLRAIQLTCSYNVEEKKVEGYFKNHMEVLRKVVHDCTVTMKPFRWYHADLSVLADPGHDYEHKVYIK